MVTRRTFLLKAVSVAGAMAILGSRAAATSTDIKLTENDKMAMILGYRMDTTKADNKKYPNHEKTQMCNGCANFRGKATDAFANCAIFPGKLVANKGWCSSWVKKISA